MRRDPSARRTRPGREAQSREAARIRRALPASRRLPLRSGPRPSRLDSGASQRPLGRSARRSVCGDTVMIRTASLLCTAIFALHAETGRDAWLRYGPAESVPNLPAVAIALGDSAVTHNAQRELIR